MVLFLALFGLGLKGFATVADRVYFTTDIGDDATPEVLKSILSAKKGSIREIKFQKGTYHFYPDKGYESFVFISNHDNVLTRTAFPIDRQENLTIDGQGSTFIFHGLMVPFLITDSKNISIKNLSIDWQTPFNSEALVVAQDVANKTFDIKIGTEYPYAIRNDQLIFLKEYYEHSIGQSILYDPKRKAIAFDTEDYTPLTNLSKSAITRNTQSLKYKYSQDFKSEKTHPYGTQERLIAKELEPGLVRIFNHAKKLPPIGMILVGKGDQASNRVAPAFRVLNCETFNATNVTVHHAGGMGLIAENSSDLTLDAFNVRPSGNRMVSTTADATHFVGCRGKISIRNCVFNNQLDDASNIHGTYEEVVEQLDPYTLGVRIGHFQQQNFVLGKPGDSIGLIRLNESFDAYAKNTVESVQKINGRYHIIKFKDKLDTRIQPGDLLENLDAYPEVLVQNCTISNNRARGLLLSTPKKTVVEGNFFSTEMEAILIPVESGSWFESGSGANISITNNTFKDCQHSGFNRGVIRLVTDDESEHIAFRNIDIHGNTFEQFDNLILEVSNTENLRFEKNKITNSGTFPQKFPENPAVVVKTSKEVLFKDNTYTGKATQILSSDDPSIQAPLFN